MPIRRNDETAEDFAARERAEGTVGEAQNSNLPHRLEDEKYTISLALNFPGVAEELVARMDGEDYFNGACNLAFTAIQGLLDTQQTVTLHNVYQWLLDLAGGDSFDVLTPFELTALFDKAHFGDTRGLTDAIARLKAYTRLRIIIEAAGRARAAAFDRGRPEEIIGIFQEAERRVISHNITVIDSAQAADEAAETYDKLNRGDIVCLPSGLPEMDALLYGGGFWGGDNVVIAGETSTGKTTFALNLLIRLCSMGFRGLYFSLEMKRFKVVSRIHSNVARVPNWKIRPHMDERSGQGISERLRLTLDRVKRLPFKIDDETKRVDDMARVARYEVKQKGVDFVITDYMGLCKPPRGFRGGAFERATEVSHILTEAAHDLGVPWFNVCQLRRLMREDIAFNQSRGKDTNEPSIEMLKQSGDIENDADTVVMLWRNKEDVKEGVRNQLVDAWGKLGKQRQGELGRFKLLFAPDIYHFTSPKLVEEETRRGEAVNF